MLWTQEGQVKSIGNPKRERRLVVQCDAELSDGSSISFEALVDTGAEINVVSLHKVLEIFERCVKNLIA